MTVLKAIVKDGRIEMDAPGDWPEGMEVRIEPAPILGPIGIREEEWPDSPDALNRHLASMDRIEPLHMTPEEEAVWDAARQSQKESEKSRFDEHAETLRAAFTSPK